MAKILENNQSYVMGHFVQVLHALDDKLDSNVDVTNNTQAVAQSAFSTASTALTNAAIAQVTAQNAVDRLAGDADFFIGAFAITTSTTFIKPASITTNSSQGISWDNVAKKFNFSYLGWYLIELYTEGDMNNTRPDWYQEHTLTISQNTIRRVSAPNRIPPLGTWNMRFISTQLIKISQGDIITPEFANVANGTVNSGFGTIRIKKVV